MALSPRVAEGFRLIGKGRLAEAEEAGLARLREAPEDPQAWHLIGVLRLKQSRLDESREALSHATRLAPGDARIHVDLGSACLAAGRVEEAESLFLRAVAARPDWAAAHFNVGIALRRQRRFLESARSFARAARLDARDHAAVQACVDSAAEAVRTGQFTASPLRRDPAPFEDVSVVFCSPDRERLERSRERLQRQTEGSNCEVLAVLAPPSLAAAYNDAAQNARHERLLFVHDDVEFLSPKPLAVLSRALDRVDVVGLAGSRRAAGPAPMWAGHPGLHGWIAYPAEGKPGFDASVFSLSSGLIGGMQTLDGLLIAARRRCVLSVGFDARTFDGFHFYDLDFTVRAALAGFSIAVTTDVVALHASRGNFGADWQRYRQRFLEKFPRLDEPMGAAHWYGAHFESTRQVTDFYDALRGLAEEIAP